MKTQINHAGANANASRPTVNCTASALTISPATYGRVLSAIFLTLLLCVAVQNSALAQQAPAQAVQSQGAAGNAVHGLLPLVLDASIDSKKLKQGDEVEGKTIAVLKLRDGTTVPSGTRVVGHVTESKARARGEAESALAIAFESINLPGGKSVPINSTIQAVGPNPNAEAQTGGGMGYTGMTMDLEMPASPKLTPRSVALLNEQSTGVLGIKNLQLGSDGVLTSDAKSVKLERGYQILLKVSIAG